MSRHYRRCRITPTPTSGVNPEKQRHGQRSNRGRQTIVRDTGVSLPSDDPCGVDQRDGKEITSRDHYVEVEWESQVPDKTPLCGPRGCSVRRTGGGWGFELQWVPYLSFSPSHHVLLFLTRGDCGRRPFQNFFKRSVDKPLIFGYIYVSM